MSYDEAYAGQTDLVVESQVSDYVPQSYQRVDNVRFGSVTINASWDKDDTLTTTGHYEARSLREACEDELSGQWDFASQECSTGGSTLGPAVTCEDAYPNRRLRLGGVFPHGYKCETTTRANDTMLLAAEGWSNQPEVVYTLDPDSGYYVPEYYPRTQHLDHGGFDDNSGPGTNAKITMPADSTRAYSAFVVGLHPWNDQYGSVPLNRPNTRFPDARIRVYRDELLVPYDFQPNTNDSDNDGLSASLEAELGTTAGRADTDYDGIIDGFEVYGSDNLPLPSIGTNPLRRQIITEVDVAPGFDIDSERVMAMRSAGLALEEANVDLISLTGEFAEVNEVTSCGFQYDFWEGEWYWACTDEDVHILPGLNTTSSIPTSSQDSSGGLSVGEECDARCLRNDAAGFDLAQWYFVRRVAFASLSSGTCGSAFVHGRAAVVKCDGSSYTHEIGHLWGLRHGGLEDDKVYEPNYWSVMNYGVTLPHPDYSSPVDFETRETFLLGDMKPRPARFSDGRFIDLDESQLDEEAGLTGGTCQDSGCTSYTDPVDFNGIRDPNSPGSAQSPNFTDIEVRWLDWDEDGGRDSTTVSAAIDSQCSLVSPGEFKNENTGETGSSKSVCYEVLDDNDDMADDGQGQLQYACNECSTADEQRVELGLQLPSECETSLDCEDDEECDIHSQCVPSTSLGLPPEPAPLVVCR
jgi:hypothetical protein